MDKNTKDFAIGFANWVSAEYKQDEGCSVGYIYRERGSDLIDEYDIPELLELYIAEIEGDGFVFNFVNFLKVGKRVLTGKEYGLECKELLNIGKILENSKITFIVPSIIMSISPSFLEAYFGDEIIKYGIDEFLEKVKFKNEGKYSIDSEMLEAIQRVLRKK